MERSKLNQEELKTRCEKVFFFENNEKVYDVTIDKNETVGVYLSDTDSDGEEYFFTYLPDMTERPEALDYIMGRRDDFND